jgi:hypothetical protein
MPSTPIEADRRTMSIDDGMVTVLKASRTRTEFSTVPESSQRNGWLEMGGWYVDVVVGYLIRILIWAVRAGGSSTWPVEKATVSDSRCSAASYEGPVAEVVYTYIAKRAPSPGIHREPFLSHVSAEDYAARFPAGSDVNGTDQTRRARGLNCVRRRSDTGEA